MNEENHKEILEGLFPVGKERWIKVLYKDFNGASKIYVRVT